MHRKVGQQSMAEAFLPEQVGRNERLERIGEAVDWDRIGKIDSLVKTRFEEVPAL